MDTDGHGYGKGNETAIHRREGRFRLRGGHYADRLPAATLVANCRYLSVFVGFLGGEGRGMESTNVAGRFGL
jgi:hypothetical protein